MGRAAVSPYEQLWRVVDGAVTDAFNRHPDYLTPKGARSAKASINKRVTGTVLSFAVEAAKSQRERAETASRVFSPEPQASASPADAGAGAASVGPTSFRVRIVNVRLKRRSRYRSPQAFDLMVNRLRREARAIEEAIL